MTDNQTTPAITGDAPAQPANITGATLALLTTGGFFGLLGLFAWREIPAGSRDLVNIMLGSLASGWTAIVSYYFGSSIGHAQATRTIEHLATTRPDAP